MCIRDSATTCNGSGSIDFVFTGIANGTYDITYTGGKFTVSVSGGKATASGVAVGSYKNLQIASGGCTTPGADVAITAPNAPTLQATANNATTCNGNGSIDFVFTRIADGTYDITY